MILHVIYFTLSYTANIYFRIQIFREQQNFCKVMGMYYECKVGNIPSIVLNLNRKNCGFCQNLFILATKYRKIFLFHHFSHFLKCQGFLTSSTSGCSAAVLFTALLCYLRNLEKKLRSQDPILNGLFQYRKRKLQIKDKWKSLKCFGKCLIC